MKQKRFFLSENDIPSRWYNITADMKNKPQPILNPATRQPVTVEDLSELFSEECSRQELNTTDRWIEIPEEVREKYTYYRSTPLVRAYGLEKALGTTAHIYFKNESVSPIGSHKLNSALAQAYPCYYVTGNHEWWSGEAERICDDMEAVGVTVLQGACETIAVNENDITVCGVDDPDSGMYENQLELVGEKVRADGVHILLSHRPERIEDYLEYPFDLILSGHAHGGQWRMPGIINGLYAPNQGVFPRYAGGRYDFGSTVFLVSRGLARESTKIPRVFNRPELVVVDLIPA